MIHVQIPRYRSIHEANGSIFVTYEVHINGHFHCSCRYSELRELHEAIRAYWSGVLLPLAPFPPKKVTNLSSKQLDRRREQLEAFLQSVIHSPTTSQLPLLTEFFFNQQVRSNFNVTTTSLKVYLCDGTEYSIGCAPFDTVRSVLKSFASIVNLPEPTVCDNFGLFIVKKSKSSQGHGQYSFVRWLRSFESPVLSLFNVQSANATVPHKVIVRKTYWDYHEKEKDVMDGHPMGSRLLFAQAFSDVDSGVIHLDAYQMRRLDKLKAEGFVREYVKQSQPLPYYGCMQFNTCSCDYPELSSEVMPVLVNRHIVLRSFTEKGEAQERWYRIDKIRSWKLVALPSNSFKFSFEWAQTEGRTTSLVWISLFLDQGPLLTLCLHSMVEEFVRQRRQGSWHGAAASDRGRLASVGLSTSNSSAYVSFTENGAFEEITDSDL